MNDITLFKEQLGDYLKLKHNININKPFRCLNPNHEDLHPSMSYSEKYRICKCFSCGVCYDIFDLIGIDYDTNNFKEQLTIAEDLFHKRGYNKDKIINPNKYVKQTNYDVYYSRCICNIDKTNYLSTRKIDNRLIKKYNIGYDEDDNTVVFPIDSFCYFKRGTLDDKKIKSKGLSRLWNEKLINNDNDLLYITESIIDGLSLETIDENVRVVSLNGLPNYKRLLKVIEENNFNGSLVLAFDSDKTGLYYREKVKKLLDEMGIKSFSTTLISNIEDCKDINEALIKDREKLENNFKYFNEKYKDIIRENKKEDGLEI